MPLEVFTQRNFVADFIRLKLNFIPKTEKSVFEPPFGGLRGNICTPSIACRKGLLNFLFAIIAFFRYLLRLRRYKRKSVEVGVYRRGWFTLSADFRGKGASLTNHCWYQKTRVIVVSCGMKISAVLHLLLSQYTPLTDGQTDRQNCDNTTVRCLTCSRTVKTKLWLCFLLTTVESKSV